MIGPGRVRSTAVHRPLWAGHPCVAYDVRPDTGQWLVNGGDIGSKSIENDFDEPVLSVPYFNFASHEETDADSKAGA